MKEIPLTRGKVALVDDADYERLMALGKWHLNRHGYAVRSVHLKKENGKYKCSHTIRMHRFLMGLELNDGRIIDHKDGNTLNNQKKNLRECSHKENSRNARIPKNNKSGYKGVSWSKQRNKWIVKIRANGILIYLGLFDCLTTAARAYNEAAIKYHGEFARLNPL